MVRLSHVIKTATACARVRWRGGLIACLVLLVSSLLLPYVVISAPSHGTPTSGGGTPATGPGVSPPPQEGSPADGGTALPSPSPLPTDQFGSKEAGTKSASKLSPRLRLLADLAATGSLPADVGEQDRLLSLAGSGAGSLSRDMAGNVVVDSRVTDTSAETVAALTALPADVLSVAPEYATITLAIAPNRLNDLASLAAIQYVGEVIRPDGNAPGGASTAVP